MRTHCGLFYYSCSVCIVHTCVANILQIPVHKFSTAADVEKFLLKHGEQVIDVLGSEVDRVELEIKVRLIVF